MKAKKLWLIIFAIIPLAFAGYVLAAKNSTNTYSNTDSVANSESTELKSLTAKVVLKKIVAKILTEKEGDELYLNVTEFSNEGEASYTRIPHKPIFWPSLHMDKIKDIKIWEKQIALDTSYEVVIELVEHDVPPWNVDDLIGVIRLRIKNEEGVLKYQWSIFDQEMPMDAEFPGAENTFNFDIHDKYGHYLLEFVLEG